VKCVAGCSTDEVPGAKRVGEKTVIKWIKGELAFGTKAFQTINEFIATPEYQRNTKLVCLPFAKIKQFKLREDKLTKEGWQEVTKALGMKSIRSRPPFRIKKRSKV